MYDGPDWMPNGKLSWDWCREDDYNVLARRGQPLGVDWKKLSRDASQSRRLISVRRDTHRQRWRRGDGIFNQLTGARHSNAGAR